MWWAPFAVPRAWRSQTFQAGTLKFVEVLQDAHFPKSRSQSERFPGHQCDSIALATLEPLYLLMLLKGLFYNLIL